MADSQLIDNKYCLGLKSAVGDPERKYEDRAYVSGDIETKSKLGQSLSTILEIKSQTRMEKTALVR